MEKMKIRELTLGEFFRLSDSENAPVWVRGESCALHCLT